MTATVKGIDSQRTHLAALVRVVFPISTDEKNVYSLIGKKKVIVFFVLKKTYYRSCLIWINKMRLQIISNGCLFILQ